MKRSDADRHTKRRIRECLDELRRYVPPEDVDGRMGLATLWNDDVIHADRIESVLHARRQQFLRGECSPSASVDHDD